MATYQRFTKRGVSITERWERVWFASSLGIGGGDCGLTLWTARLLRAACSSERSVPYRGHRPVLGRHQHRGAAPGLTERWQHRQRPHAVLDAHGLHPADPGASRRSADPEGRGDRCVRWPDANRRQRHRVERDAGLIAVMDRCVVTASPVGRHSLGYPADALRPEHSGFRASWTHKATSTTPSPSSPLCQREVCVT